MKRIIIFFVTAVLFTSCSKQDWETSLSIVSTLANIGTLIIAIIAFDQFGIKGSKKRKEVELVKKFYEKLKDVVIDARTNQSLELTPGVKLDPSQEVTLMIRPYYNIDYFDVDELNGKSIIFTSGYHKYFSKEIAKIVQNQYFPREIFEKFKFIEHEISQVYLNNHDWDLDKYIYLKTLNIDFERTVVTFPIGIQALKFQHVLNNYKNIVSETEDYLNKNGYKIIKKYN
jgi:hypothetical protein